MKTYPSAIENHMVIGGFCDSYVRGQRHPTLTCAACLSDGATDDMTYMPDVRNYICPDCRDTYREVSHYIRPLKWYQ